MRPIALLLLAAAAACDEPPPTDDTALGAFALMASCVDQRDAGCLFERLDRDSRWSVQTIHRTLGEMSELVTRSYPTERRAGAFGAFGAEAKAESPRGVFQAWCSRTGCLERLAERFGAVTDTVTSGPDEERLSTTRGGCFRMARADGRFGLADHRDALDEAKIRLLDRLAQVRRDADAYEAQRVANGDSATAPPTQKEADR